VAIVTLEDVPVEVRAIGNAEVFRTVSVQARVTGQITKVYYPS